VAFENETQQDCGKVDIFVRTSNVKRLSDFQMWQVGHNPSCFLKQAQEIEHTVKGDRVQRNGREEQTRVKALTTQAAGDTQLHFVKTYWPEFGLTDMLPILLGWQQKVWLRSLGF
jgi:ditrans,polycis-polyprenyl diphosphate synthase